METAKLPMFYVIPANDSAVDIGNSRIFDSKLTLE